MNLNQAIKFAKNIKWYRQAGNIKMYYLFSPCRGASDSLKAPGGFFSIRKNKYFEGFYEEELFNLRAREIIALGKRDGIYIDRKMAKCRLEMKKLEKFYKKYSKKNITRFNYNEVRKAIFELNRLKYFFWREVYIGDFFDPNGVDFLNVEIKKSGVKLTTAEVAILLRFKKLNYGQEERLAMIKIALKIKNKKLALNSNSAGKFLKSHSKKYFYVDNSWESTKILTAENFKNKLKELVRQSREELGEQFKDLTENWEKLQTEIIKRYKIKKELKNVFYIFSSMIFLRDERKKYTQISNHFFDLFYARLAKILKIPFELLKVATDLDLKDELNGSKYKKILKDRGEIVIECYYNHNSTIFSGQDGVKIYEILAASTSGEQKDLKGNSAYPGKVRGRVSVIMGETHFGKFNPGDILVAPMTRPEYLSLIKQAKAIVTDEGGITCHAAIISRELKKPCIIGTRVATKVLHDGDLVEVDADKGLVKILYSTTQIHNN